MRTTLYWFEISHPSQAVRLMLERKGIEYSTVELLPGMHPVLLRLLGFAGTTVPALRYGQSKLLGSTTISRFLDAVATGPSLFPRDPDARRAVEDAERWGEAELQPISRRIFRWAVAGRSDLRRWMADEVVGLPAPGLAATVNAPVARALARKVHADEQHVRDDLRRLPALLDRVDELIGEGVIGGDEPNAADFQIGTSIWALMRFSDLRRFVEGRPAAVLAERLLPARDEPVPPGLPPEWLPVAPR